MRLVFMGTPEAAVPTLRRCVESGHEIVAVWTQPDRPAGRGHKLTVSPVKEYALAHSIPVYQFARIKTAEAEQLFSAHQTDAAIVVAYGRILPASFLCAPKAGCINVHFSLLPKYRGAAPVNWAIVRGERETGVTTMRMDEGLDTGPIYLQRALEIGDDQTAAQVVDRLSVLGAELLCETLERLDDLTPRVQASEDATLAPILRREDGRINWDQSAVEIERAVRGFQPWPNAHAEYDGRRVIIWRASAQEALSPPENAYADGEIVEARADALVVACGGGGTALRIHELQPETKRRMSARDFLNGAQKMRAGEKFV